MDSKNSTAVCRLCLETSEDSVNIFDRFQNSTIASILTKHFWFQVHKDDGMSDWLCQICWIQTKTFHHFYKRIQYRHGSDCRPNAPNQLISSDDIKRERSVSPRVLEPDLTLIKSEETELASEAIDSQMYGHGQSVQTAHSLIRKEGSIINCSADKSNSVSLYDLPSHFILGENSRTTDDEEQVSNQNYDGDDDFKVTDNQTPVTKLKKCSSHTRSEIEEQNVQIREFFTMKCEICTEVEFETLVKAKHHYRNVHQKRGFVMCCGRKFWRRFEVLNHIQTHINPDAFRCGQCGKNFKDKCALESHIKNHVPIDSRAYKCNLCSISFTKKCLLKYHMQNKHSPDTGETFPCTKCDKSFRSKWLLVSHVRGVHEYSLEHVCDICARRFKTNTLLQSHIASEHSTTPQPKAQCHICGAWLKHKVSLRKHLMRLHQDVEAFHCTLCDKVAKNKASLASHVKNAHGERCHQCLLCDKAFKCAKNLKEHVALHTGEDLYNCPYCEKKFKSNGNMYSHRKKAHLAEWTRDSAQREALKNNSANEEPLTT